MLSPMIGTVKYAVVFFNLFLLQVLTDLCFSVPHFIRFDHRIKQLWVWGLGLVGGVSPKIHCCVAQCCTHELQTSLTMTSNFLLRKSRDYGV